MNKFITYIFIPLLLIAGCNENSVESADGSSASLGINVIIPQELAEELGMVTDRESSVKDARAAIVLPPAADTFIATVRGADGSVVSDSLTASGTLSLVVPSDIELAVTVEALDSTGAWLLSGTTYNVIVTGGEQTTVDVVMGAASPEITSRTGSDGTVSLSWIGLTGGDPVHNVYWDVNPGITTASNKVEVEGTSYEHTGRTNGTTYYYAVTAQNANDESDLSQEVCVTPPATPVEPVAPGSLAASYACYYGDATISLGWAPVDGVASYTVYDGDQKLGNSISNSFAFTPASASMHDLTVMANNTCASSELSEVFSIQSEPCGAGTCSPVAQIPSNVSVSHTCNDFGGTDLTVSWSGSGDTFNVYEKSYFSGVGFTYHARGTTGQQSYTYSTADIIDVNIVVRSKNACGESDDSVEVNYSTGECYVPDPCDPYDPYDMCYMYRE